MIEVFQLKAFTELPSIKLSGHICIQDQSLQIRYKIELKEASDTLTLQWPAKEKSACFRDGLWQSTCLELFYGKVNSPEYTEWNFSPAGHWACYSFSAYRQLQAKQTELLPVIRSGQDDDYSYWLESSIPFTEDSAVEIHIAAVLHCNDELTYWSLLHPADKPDFHDRRSFLIKYGERNS